MDTITVDDACSCGDRHIDFYCQCGVYTECFISKPDGHLFLFSSWHQGAPIDVIEDNDEALAASLHEERFRGYCGGCGRMFSVSETAHWLPTSISIHRIEGKEVTPGIERPAAAG